MDVGPQNPPAPHYSPFRALQHEVHCPKSTIPDTCQETEQLSQAQQQGHRGTYSLCSYMQEDPSKQQQSRVYIRYTVLEQTEYPVHPKSLRKSLPMKTKI